MRTRPVLPAFFAASLLLWPGMGAAAQQADPPKEPNARIPVYVTAWEPAAAASEFTQPGTDTKSIADSVKDIQEAFTAMKTRWVRLVADRAEAVVVIGVSRRTYDDGPEIMSVYTDVTVGGYTFAITGAGDPWRNAARSVVRQLDEWVKVNYPALRERTPGPAPGKE
jgi:hypothetical protein